MNKGYEILFEDGRRIVKGLGHYPASYVTDCRGLVKGTVKKYGNKTAFKFKRNGKTVEISYKAFDNHIDALGTALHSLGLKDNKIAIIGENRYEWAVAYFSVINGTGVGVPLDKYLPAIEIENLVNRSGATAIFYSQAFHDVMVGISKKENSLKYFISMDNQNDDSENTRFLNMQSLIDKGRELLDKGDKSFVDAQINRETLSILLFTSGTTKAAKGVMLSHKNVASNVTALTGCIEIFPTDVHLSLLPLHHTFESTLGMLFMLHAGVTIAYSEGIRHIAQELKDFNVSILVAVPAIFEALYSKLISGIEKAGKLGLVNFLKKVTGLLLKLGIDTRKKFLNLFLISLAPV
jgi:long-chain acyl-CoA synthetase